MTRNNVKMPEYREYLPPEDLCILFVRSIPKVLRDEVKAIAVREGKSMREKMCEIMLSELEYADRKEAFNREVLDKVNLKKWKLEQEMKKDG